MNDTAVDKLPNNGSTNDKSKDDEELQAEDDKDTHPPPENKSI